MASKQAKSAVVASTEQLIAGTSKHLANVTQVLVAGGSFTPAQVAATLQSIVDLRRQVDAARATMRAKLVNERAAMPALRTFRGALVSFINGAFANQPDVLADFGIHPKARTPLTAEANTAAVAKRNATRAARHTMGSKQRKRIKGAVTGVLVTPVTHQPSAKPNAAPANPPENGATAPTAPAPSPE
jgi:hypothetical protein